VQEINKFFAEVYSVDEFKSAISIFKGVKGVAMATKFRQKISKIAQILVLYKTRRQCLRVL